jgi:hypothetical protein
MQCKNILKKNNKQSDFLFQRKERSEGIIEYFPNKHGSHFFPSVLQNIKQMFTFETSLSSTKEFYDSSVKESYNSNLVSLTLSNEGHLEIKFDGEIMNPYKESFENIDSVFFKTNNVYFFKQNYDWFH